MKLLGGLLTIMTVSIFCSCADGYKDDATFESDVRNTQLLSPEIDKSCFSTVTTASGTEQVKMTWPLIKGAGGYLVNVSLMNGDNAVAVVKDSIVDGLSVLFDKAEDSKYQVSVKTLGNTKLNNTDAAQATAYEYSTMIEGISVPEGQDIAAFVNSYIAEHESEMQAAMAEAPSSYETAFELTAGKQYTMNDSVDFKLFPVTFRSSDKYNPATVTVGENGYITTQAGVKIKFINFDCTNMKQKGLLTLGGTPDESLSTEALGLKALGATQNAFVITRPVLFQECMVKNLAYGMLYGNKANWALTDFRIQDCLVQLVNETNDPVINLYGASTGGVKDMTFKNTSFVNLKDNAVTGAYFLRLSNASNAVPRKIWGTGSVGTVKILNCTYVKCMTGTNFANNYVSNADVTFTMKGNVFYDTWRIQKFLGNCTKDVTATDNTIWGITNPVDNTDKEKYATEEDPGFTAPTSAIDLTKKNGGYNLKPTGAVAVAGQFGDPRWYN